MQKIQIITYNGDEVKYGSRTNVTFSKLSNPLSFDDFDINIIDLNESDIWLNDDNSTHTINSIKDFHTLKDIMNNSNKSNTIIILPSNLEFQYAFNRSTYSFFKRLHLKDMIPDMISIISDLTEIFKDVQLIFEPTKTQLIKSSAGADFSFADFTQNVLTKSQTSKKTTTVEFCDIIFTTLNLTTVDQILDFLKTIQLLESVERIPKWMEEIQMFDDLRQHEIIDEKRAMIAEQEKEIANAEAVLEKNRRYKSILYAQSDELVNVVFDILHEMLGFDLSNFVDEKKEDFRYEQDEIVFIGEIKGVTSNVRSEHISQLDVHYQTYIEDNVENADKTKAVLIINHQRNKPMDERKEVHQNQIKLAQRNKSLVIETYTLLKMFEKFRVGELSQKECLEVFKNNTGLLEM